MRCFCFIFLWESEECERTNLNGLTPCQRLRFKWPACARHYTYLQSLFPIMMGGRKDLKHSSKWLHSLIHTHTHTVQYLGISTFEKQTLSLCHSVSVPVPFLCLCLGPSPSVCLSPFPVLFYPFKHVQLRNKNSKLIQYILTLIPCTVLAESCITNRIFNRAKNVS